MKLRPVHLLMTTAVVGGETDVSCSCADIGCLNAQLCCPNAYNVCLSGKTRRLNHSSSFPSPDSLTVKELTHEDNRVLAYAGIKRLVHGVSVTHKSYIPLWEDDNGTVSASGLLEVEELYRTAAGLYGAIVRSDVGHTLILNGESGLYKRCESLDGDYCFPLVLAPAVETLTRIRPATIRVAYSLGASEAANQMTMQLTKTLSNETIINKEQLAGVISDASCVLLCPTGGPSMPYTKHRAPGPTAHSEYRYLPMPGVTERIAWLLSVASLVVIGTWKGSYKFHMA